MAEAASAVAGMYGGDGGGTAVVDQPVEQEVQTDAVETPADQVETEQPIGDDRPQGEQEQAQEQEQPAEPGKYAPKDVVKTLRELREQFPEKAAHLRDANDALFQRDRYREQFKTVEEAAQTKTRLEALGGWDGIRAHQANTARLEEMNQLADTGDPRFVDAWAKEAPEGMAKAAPHFLSTFQKVNPQAFTQALQPYVRGALADSGVLHLMSRMATFMENGNTERAQEEAAGIMNWVRQIERMEADAKNVRESPEIARAREAEQKASQLQSQALNQRIDGEVKPWADEQIGKAMTDLLKAHNLTAEAKKGFVNEVHLRIQQALAADPSYQANIRALRATGDVSKIARYVKGEAQALFSKTVNSLWTERGYRTTPIRNGNGNGNGAQRTQTGTQKPAQQNASAPSFVVNKPSHDEIDWSKDPERMLFITGRAHLKNGRFVTWRKGA